MAIIDKPGAYTLKIDIEDKIRTELRCDRYHLPYQVIHRPTNRDLPLLRATTKQWAHATTTDGQGPRPIFTRGIKLGMVLSVPTRIVAAAEPREPKRRDSEDADSRGRHLGHATNRCSHPHATLLTMENEVSNVSHN